MITPEQNHKVAQILDTRYFLSMHDDNPAKSAMSIAEKTKNLIHCDRLLDEMEQSNYHIKHSKFKQATFLKIVKHFSPGISDEKISYLRRKRNINVPKLFLSPSKVAIVRHEY